MTLSEPAAPRAPSPLLAGPVLPAMLRLAAPGMAAALVQVLPILVEAWRLGEVGGVTLAGVALVFPVFMVQTMLSAGAIGGAVSGAVARAVGAGDAAGAEAVARSAVVIALGGSAVMAGLVLGLGRPLFALLGGEGAVLEVAVAYAGALFPWIGLVWLFNMLSGVLRGAGDMLRPLVGMSVVAGLHLALSGPVILGGGGVEGAARLLAGVYGAGAVVMAAFLLAPGGRVRLRPGRVDWRLTRRLLGAGLLAGSQSVMTVATSLVVTGYAARFGPQVLAGYGIGARVELVMVPLIFGVGGAALALGGVATGAGLRARALRVGWTGAALAGGMVGTLGVALAALGPLWAPVFAPDPAVAEVVVAYIRRVGPFYGFFAVGLSLYFASQGLGTLALPVLGALLRLVVAAAGGALALGVAGAGPEALFLVVAGAMATYGLFNAVALRLGPWRPARA